MLQDGSQQIERLSHEVAYGHWHRMLFARFLEQNNLLMYDQYTAVTLEECSELAEEEPDCKDGWELAGRLAQKMLPQIFRTDSPVFAIKFSINHISALEELIAALDVSTYQAQDSLGWCYQFWQNKKKQQVNDSGVKIGAEELGPVTQLFTEPYMVSFLLDNALGAWWANKQLTQDDLVRANNEQELRELAAIDGVPLEYLRFVKDEDTQQWTPAAGGFEKWPEHLSEFKVLDPCCGSGHFLVAVFLMLVPLRMQLEDLTEQAAVDAVLRDNIHGLELDQRCLELAAFALALEAWRYPNSGGYRVLPELNIACSGLSITEAQKEWKDLAKGDETLSEAISWMQDTFKNAPVLGSLIDPTKDIKSNFPAPWELLNNIIKNKCTVSLETKSTTNELIKLTIILSGKYSLVTTNVPYLGRAKQPDLLRNFSDFEYKKSAQDLASTFIDRIQYFLGDNGISCIVGPQNWTSLKTYKNFRQDYFSKNSPYLVAELGPGSFDSILYDFNFTLLLTGKIKNKNTFEYYTVIAKEERGVEVRSSQVVNTEISRIYNNEINCNQDFRLIIQPLNSGVPLSHYCDFYCGIQTGDNDKFVNKYWESKVWSENWVLQQRTPSSISFFDGLQQVVYWESGIGEMSKQSGFRDRLSKKIKSSLDDVGIGFVVHRMGDLYSTIASAELYDQNGAILIPKKREYATAIWNFISSSDFRLEIRKIDSKVGVTPATLVKPAFDYDKWSLSNNLNFLPQPYSDDPSQWIFHGHPCASVIWHEETKTTAVGALRQQDDTVLQVAIARLLDYKWPAELDTEMELAPEMREVMLLNADFNGLEDDDGIVCLPAVRGEKNAVSRLEAILHKAYGTAWSSTVEANLLKAVGAKDLESWLRDKFFEQHCKLFQHRPFIWQIWDGLKDGFSVLVNYHRLDYSGLERLIYTYLDDWIGTQKRDLAEGKDGADIRLTAAENLRKQLEDILKGENGLDIFVRWKPLAEQPIGWNPDLNDGVRLNIRPFMLSKEVGKKGAGILRAKPNVHWKKDRGTDVESAPWYTLGLEYDGKLGDRINEHHLSLAVKRAARDEANE
ncbi:Eco57I restriction-modification methylase domain-containing protein [Oceanisphaera ostreae]|uniref:site-specific DNA-methyltransferase (adenine-specific) n=1 Tax=Oceanisphaera ostreae TaxID=914151 RepID=A0ABW3KLI0_9GAMM